MRVPVMPHLRQDDSDRNRTSPFAFTGNKFEFRMLGSSQSISDPNTVLNTAVAEVLGRYADRLEQSADREDTVRTLLQETLEQHLGEKDGTGVQITFVDGAEELAE